MDCRLEPAARTFARIEVVSLQGLACGLCRAVLSAAVIPIMPFVVATRLFRFASGRGMGMAARLAMLPVWTLYGTAFAFSMPFGTLAAAVRDVREVAGVEWANRWMASVPRMPDGSPARPLSAEDRERLDMAVTAGVIRDYNEEARRYGQGVEVNPEPLA